MLPDHHEADIAWERFERIQEMLAKNSQRRTPIDPGAAKRGAALVAGLLRCRRCGQKLVVSYSGANHDVHRYVCARRHVGWGDPRCLSFGGRDVDGCVAQAVLTVVRPAGIEAALSAARDQARAGDAVVETLDLELQAAQYAADRAARQDEAAEPENRLVVDELERRWNTGRARGRDLEGRLQVEQERAQSAGRPPAAESLQALGTDLSRVWDAPATDVRLKKRIGRVLLAEIVVDVTDTPPEIILVVHWKGGVHTELRVPRRRRGDHAARTPPDVVEAVRALALVCRDDKIAHWLNRAGVATARGNRWTRTLVAAFRSTRGISVYSPARQEAEGWVTLEKAAALAGVASLTLKRAVRRGVLTARQPLPFGPWLFPREVLLDPETRARLRTRDDPTRRIPAAHPSRQLTLDISHT